MAVTLQPAKRERTGSAGGNAAGLWHADCTKQGVIAFRSQVLFLAVVPLLVTGCAGQLEQAARRELRQTSSTFRADKKRENEVGNREVSADGSLAGYIAQTIEHSPVLQMSFHQWRAATLRISRARRLPEPTIGYSYFVRSVETRVGPQRHRFGLAQTFPWPTKLSAGGDAAASVARAAQRKFDAQLLTVTQQVTSAYWRIWLLDEQQRLMSEHDTILETLAGTIRGRVETAKASLADLNQIDLGVARHHDHHDQHKQQRLAAEGALLAVMGASPERTALKITDAPWAEPLRDNDESLRRAAHRHPAIEAMGLLASSSDFRAEAVAADRYPRLRLGVDYIETGEALNAEMEDSGKDPLIVSLELSIPLWQSSYTDAVQAAHAEASSRRAARDMAIEKVNAQLSASLAALRDASRTIELYRSTLIPQAETTFHSVLGGYQTGRSTVAASLLAQRELLDLQMELATARARRANAWASLENLVGRSLTEPQVPPHSEGEQENPHD